MADAGPPGVIVAGAGIAGLTTALAFASKGQRVRVFEQAARLEEVGAGLQLSPNATRILSRLGVLGRILPHAVQPAAVLLKDAVSLRLLARIPLGEIAEDRWKAPYLVVHRADLQRALLAAVAETPGIEIVTAAAVTDFQAGPDGPAITMTTAEGVRHERGALIVGADGVWSRLRSWCGGAESRFAGEIAWRTTIERASTAGFAFDALTSSDCVTTFLNPAFHLVAHPVRAGAAVNLVAFTKGEIAKGGEANRDRAKGNSDARDWAARADSAELLDHLQGADRMLLDIVKQAGPWTAWPLHTVDAASRWFRPDGLVLVGDAAHAMTPFAAQGAAMAIEDAATLADCIVSNGRIMASEIPDRLQRWERLRKPRVAKVARRGALNHLAWHAAGPVALARNFLLSHRSPQKLAADLDWLYGDEAVGSRQ